LPAQFDYGKLENRALQAELLEFEREAATEENLASIKASENSKVTF